METEELLSKLSASRLMSHDPVECTLELGKNGIEVKRKDETVIHQLNPERNFFKGVLGKSSWERIHSQSVLMPTDEEDVDRVLLIFRSSVPHTDLSGFENEVFVLWIDSELEGNEIINEMLKWKKSTGFHPANGDTPVTLKQKTKSRQPEELTPRAKRGSRNTLYASDGRNVYILNRCLDDIHAFGGRLNRCIKYDNQDRMSLQDRVTRKLPSAHAASECVRKVKYSLNLNEELLTEAPEAAAKIFIRLIKFTRWLDKVCVSGVVPSYANGLVKDMVEPLLASRTMDAVSKHLNSDAAIFWQSLGPTWNTSPTQWPDPVVPYTPHFKTKNTNGTLDVYKHMTMEPRMPMQSMTLPYYSTEHLDKTPKVTLKEQQPKIRNKDHERYYIKAQERGTSLCFATVRHLAATPEELNAGKGEIFEILDQSEDDWWSVENYTGETGNLPSWKLQPTWITPDILAARSTETYRRTSGSPIASPRYQRGFSTNRRSEVYHHPWDTGRRTYNHREGVRSRSVGSYLNTSLTPNEEEKHRSFPAMQPLVVYWPGDRGSYTSPCYQTMPMVMMPQSSYSRNRSQHSSPSRPSSRGSPRRMDDTMFHFPDEDISQTPMMAQHDHPYSTASYTPRIRLDRKPPPPKTKS